MRSILKIAKTLDIVGLYKLSDKFFKIAQENILDGFKTFDYENELINKPTNKYILKPVDDYIVQPVDKFTDLTIEGTNKLTKAVDDYAVKPAVGIAKFVDNKAKQIAKTPSKIKQKLNPPKDTDTYQNVKLEGTMVHKDYKSNILKYKQLVGENKLPEAASFLNNVLKSDVLNSNQKAAFEAQASRIVNYYSINDPRAADEPLYTQGYIGKMLKKYKISLSDIKRENLSENEFDKRWENLKKELPEDKQNTFQKDFLQRTYDILTAHYKNSA
jgi:hypothetical protein